MCRNRAFQLYPHFIIKPRYLCSMFYVLYSMFVVEILGLLWVRPRPRATVPRNICDQYGDGITKTYKRFQLAGPTLLQRPF
ncbi:hypothetical protein BDQ12DRAFT_372635 [Crucibulum laeve]|uniref:Uncharacterized protein n=1 Tax=Crucibulum laeve TaxID=68775 RepID=A0A5C3LPX2_9AGAR|nr:hypothetical protein BDQ12DRAFT_372635 [Crucibulum laeve]